MHNMQVGINFPECCDKREVIDLNDIEFQTRQTRWARNVLAQVSDRVTLTVNSESAEVEVVEGDNNLNLNAAVQDNAIDQTANMNSPINNLTTTDSQDIISIESPTNVHGIFFAQCSDGSFLSYFVSPKVRIY